LQPPCPIELREVAFAYEGGPPILQGIKLKIRRGEFTGIVAATGSGKSTLLHLMAGIIPHYTTGRLEGQVLIEGVDTRELNLARIAASVGVVTQDPENQLFNLLVKDEVVWALENRGFAKDQMEQRLGETLAFFNIAALRERITYDLSGGEKQRVVLASTHIFHPDILILDNPTSQLDPAGSGLVIESVKKILQEHQTVIMVEDKIDELLEHADRLIFLHLGRVVLDIPPRELSQHTHELERIGIRPPEVVSLSRGLVERGIRLERLPAGLEDAIDLYASRLAAPPSAAREPAQVAAVPASAANGRHPEGAGDHLVISDVHFTYPPPRTIQALAGVSLSVPRGSFVAVIGKNGSGKTTLARCISGYLKPRHGHISIGGEDVSRLPLKRRVQRVGYVFQNPDHQIFKDPVRADVEFGPLNLGRPPEEVAQRATRILEMLELKQFEHVHPYTLTKGNRQRLAIAAIAVMEPEVLIVDEPTTGQDPVHAREVMDLLTRLRDERGTTIITITHAMNLVGEYCDRVIAMSEGRVLIDGAPAEVFAHPEILEKTAVMPPPVTQLALRLGLTPPPITVDQAVETFAALLGGPAESPPP
jgi:energy-coupling factor transport system ATP-binding protein